MSTSTQIQKVHDALSARRERRRWERELSHYATPAERLELVALLDHAEQEDVHVDIRLAVLRAAA